MNKYLIPFLISVKNKKNYSIEKLHSLVQNFTFHIFNIDTYTFTQTHEHTHALVLIIFAVPLHPGGMKQGGPDTNPLSNGGGHPPKVKAPKISCFYSKKNDGVCMCTCVCVCKCL